MEQLSKYELLSVIPLSERTPSEFREYIKGLQTDYLAKQAERKAEKGTGSTSPVSGISFHWNKKGTPVLTMRRKPKWISPEEIKSLHEAYNVPSNVLWTLVRTKGIEVTEHKVNVKLD